MADPEGPVSALVLDASVAVKWHLKDEDYAAEAALLLEDFGQGELELVAPAQIRYEVPSAFRWQRSVVTPASAPLRAERPSKSS